MIAFRRSRADMSSASVLIFSAGFAELCAGVDASGVSGPLVTSGGLCGFISALGEFGRWAATLGSSNTPDHDSR